MDVRTGMSVNALQTLSKSQMTPPMGRAGQVDEGNHIIVMSYALCVDQVRAQDVAQLDESDLSPMIVRARVWSILLQDAFLVSPRPTGYRKDKKEYCRRGSLQNCQTLLPDIGWTRCPMIWQKKEWQRMCLRG